MMVCIQPIRLLTQAQLEQIVPGYSSSTRFQVAKTQDDAHIGFSLALTQSPFTKIHDYSDPSILAHYNEVARQGHSFGVFDGESLVGFVVAEMVAWNQTLVIREFGISPEHRRQGLGKDLLEHACAHARTLGLRGVLCETQTTNVPAIRLYQRLGFSVAGLDLGLYSNQDMKRGEVAIFLRREISPI